MTLRTNATKLTFTHRPHLLPSVVHAFFEPLFDALQFSLVGNFARAESFELVKRDAGTGGRGRVKVEVVRFAESVPDGLAAAEVTKVPRVGVREEESYVRFALGAFIRGYLVHIVVVVVLERSRGRPCELVDSIDIGGERRRGVGCEIDIDGVGLPGIFGNLEEVRNVGRYGLGAGKDDGVVRRFEARVGGVLVQSLLEGTAICLGMDIGFSVATDLYTCQSIMSSRTYSCFGSLPAPKALAARLLAMESWTPVIFMRRRIVRGCE